MSMLGSTFRAVLGLFVDDGSLALAIIATVVLTGIIATLVPNMPLLAGAVLLGGCLCVLFVNVVKARGQKSRDVSMKQG